ncbi:CDP-glycerol glycerophosphotransferase family protein [Actinomyces procaprae]|uniref:CDP-glycerol glycerophosphotransferase family protein n=1 Tax=Actinomyces procaprae TaxID=2560010 RepID=UPI00109DBE2C|nr:CDP-glycerol glycerophosphotransferase family protein [Actinomyces procaprae]
MLSRSARQRRPALSAVLLVGAGAHVDRAARSLLNQRPGEVEVLAVVMDECPEPERAVLDALAARNRHVRTLEGTLAAALDTARGSMLTVMSAADAAARDGYGRVPVDDAVHLGGCRRLAQGPGRRMPPRRVLRGIAADPALLEDFSPARVLAPASAWIRATAAVQGGSPERAARAAALTLLTDAEAVWAEPQDLVLTAAAGPQLWEERLAALADEVAADRRALAGRDPALIAALHHRAMIELAVDVPAQPDAAGAQLRQLAHEVLTAHAGAPVWSALALPDRLLLWVLAHAGTDELLEVLASRTEGTPTPALRLEHGQIHAAPPVLDRITPPPAALLAVTDADLRIRQQLAACAWEDGERLALTGWAYVPGLAPESHGAPELILTDATDREAARADVERIEAPLADLDADDAGRTYIGSGYRAVLDLAHAPAGPLRAQLRIRVGGRTLTDAVPPPLGSRRPCASALGRVAGADGEALVIRAAQAGGATPEGPRNGPEPDPGAPRVVVDYAGVDEDRLRLGGAGCAPAGLSITAVSSGRTVSLSTTANSAGWTAVLDLADPEVPSGGYRLHWSAGAAAGRCHTGARLDGPPTELSGRVRHVRLRPQPDGGLDLSIIAPVAPQHRSSYGRRALIERDWGPLLPGVFFETFGGKSAGDNPGAIRDELMRRGTSVPLWVSVRDGNVPVPAGAAPVVVGTPEWFRALRTARLLVVNDNLPYWFSKRPGQVILQTWHGTPVKHLLNDAPCASVTLAYRRLMARQVPQWDLLLAQTSAAERDLRHGLGYSGEVLVGEQPRNVGLLGGAATARHVRDRLGIAPGEPVILYAPTWREDLRRPGSGAPGLLDAASLARTTGAVVLWRSHHMNARTAGGDRVLDVSRYESLEGLMLASDLLITDYSSVVHDWALTGRPAVLHVPDLDAYRDRERGFYRDWPKDSGLPVSRTQAEAEAHAVALLAARAPAPQVDDAPVRACLDAICAWIDTVLPGAVPARCGED